MKVRYFYAVGTSAELATHSSGLIGRGFIDEERAKNVEAELHTHEEITDVKTFYIDIETTKKPKETRGITSRVVREYNGIKTFPAKPKVPGTHNDVQAAVVEAQEVADAAEVAEVIERKRDEKGRFVKTA